MTSNTTDQKRILVTGGGGFLGGAIVDRLVARGDRVRSFSRGYYPGLASVGVEQVQGDLAVPAEDRVVPVDPVVPAGKSDPTISGHKLGI